MLEGIAGRARNDGRVTYAGDAGGKNAAPTETKFLP